MTDRLQVTSKSEVVIERLSKALERHGFWAYRSFDLRNALATLPDCGCPHHGTSQCTCQYAVLLVYGAGSAPVLIVVHGRDTWTWLTIPEAGDLSATMQHRVREITLATLRDMEVLAASAPPG